MDIFSRLAAWFESTHLQEQLKDVDFVGLFCNPWFIVPFGFLVGYMVFKQKWRDLIIFSIFIAAWWASGTDYMNSLTVKGELQIDKILPVLFGGAGALGVVIYLLFGRSD